MARGEEMVRSRFNKTQIGSYSIYNVNGLTDGNANRLGFGNCRNEIINALFR